ncbi:LacI family DNA-binding transcriptional regulator [Bifidobacterium sp. LC6]|uniref:Ribokinase n=1 Tax=Bifidobacterium colobi TaxID=2809026 RepID=A0ABS5UVD9_9BIFI|nr:PfkB family carbohydrate kinase [Bifidobacterium colobi]MBT1175019.1 LacI family DNA-binding transcriptional regulator [Bifidobacterium colobi]
MNIKDIARIAGVSTSTVSKIVNGKDSTISEETRKKVLAIVKEYHYKPYAAASKRTRSYTIGVLLRSPISFDSTLDGIIEAAQNAGYATAAYNSYSDPEQELKNIAAVCGRNVDGVIWEPATPNSLEYASQFPQGTPLLTIGPNGGDQSLLLPYKEAAYKLTNELIERGHRHIACLMTKGRRTHDFLEGFRTCLFDHQMPFDDDMVHYELDDSLAGQIGSHAITGFVSSHYRRALEFMQMVRPLHYRIPEDASLVSIKNDTAEALAFPSNTEISTYTIRNSDFGSYLCAKLIAQIEHDKEQHPSFVQDFHLDNTSTLAAPPSSIAKHVLVVGSINIDHYMSVPRLPHVGGSVSTRSDARYPGGKGVNQAIGAAKLGHRVALIGNVGMDTGSDFLFKELEQYGINTAGMRRCAEESTGSSYIFLDPDGESIIAILSGANALLQPSDITNNDHLFEHAGYCLIQTEIPIETALTAARAAHQHHAKTIVKPSSIERLPDELLANTDILVPNNHELSIIEPTGKTMEDRAANLIEHGAGCVIVTMGERGCYLLSRDGEAYVPAADFLSVDSTGAGDAFISALAAYLMYGYDLKHAIRIATLAAGYSVTHKGVIPSLIDQLTLDMYIRQDTQR